MASENAPGRRWPKKIFLGINFTSILTVVVLVIATMTGAYIWGVITGRQMEKPVAASAPEITPNHVEEASADKILKAHELEFTQILRDENRRAAPEVKPEEISPEPQPEAQPEASATPSPAAVDDGTIYDFVYQVAALKDERAADNLRQSLEGAGLRTRLESNNKHYLVLVLMRGTFARANELSELARQLRLGDPMLRSKKTVSQPSGPAGAADIQKDKEN